MTSQAPRRRWTVKPWPWPGDSREDKAKRIALSYRQLAADIIARKIHDPATALASLDQRWAAHGHHWLNPPGELMDHTGLDEWQTAADLAHFLHRTPADIYRWARRGKIEQRVGADGSPEYSFPSAFEYQRNRRGQTYAS